MTPVHKLHSFINDLRKLVAAIPSCTRVAGLRLKLRNLNPRNLNGEGIEMVSCKRAGRDVTMENSLNAFIAKPAPIENKANIMW